MHSCCTVCVCVCVRVHESFSFDMIHTPEISEQLIVLQPKPDT